MSLFAFAILVLSFFCSFCTLVVTLTAVSETELQALTTSSRN